MTYDEASNFTHGELSGFTHLEIQLNSLQEISDKLTRDALLIPPELAKEINISLTPFAITPNFSVKTLKDFIHVSKIACTAFSTVSEKGKLLSALVSAADELLQHYSKGK